ncbi:chemotaxis protein [Methylobacterium sp. Leaf361]|uniref:methyl-accepting chemotaxis protein n=1 Tax=Methylobacterium sp. Leaf361 TaxID=1736352 RepID=UPI0006FF7F3C|nr:chemotaxis protein [Methylobacterium sp. Leaf361]
MRWLGYVSIRVVMCTTILAMAMMLLAYAGNALFDARLQARQARDAVTLTRASRQLLGTILPTRLERGAALALGGDASADPESLKAYATNRDAMVAGFASVQDLLRDRDLPSVTATMARLNAAQDAVNLLRPRIDEALRVPKPKRDPALLPAVLTVFQELLDALTATTDAVDSAIPRSDAVLQHYLVLKRSAWATRVAIGNVALRVQTSLAAGTSWSLPETVAAAEERARVQSAWSSTSEAAAQSSDAVRSAFEKAKRSNFEGEAAEAARAIFDALSQHRASPITFQDLRKRNSVEQMTIVDLANAALAEMVARAESLAAEADRVLLHSAAALLAVLLLVGLGLMALFGGVLRPLRIIATAMRALTGGDTAVAVPVRAYRNEFAPIMVAVQAFRDNLIRTRDLEAGAERARLDADDQRRDSLRQMAQRFEEAVGGMIGSVASSANALQVTAQTMTATATQTAGQSTAVAAAAERASSNVNTVAAAAEELGTSVQEIGRQADGSADLAQRAAAEADRTAARVQDLSSAVDQIGAVVGLISSIAEQTNLLALNATIEAARAGAAGRGFAVVASEVKALAAQTAKATDEISGQIAQVQASTGQAVEAIAAITARIREINGAATTIAAAVEEQGAATQEIVRNVGQAATGTGEVTTTMTGVAQAAEGTGLAASQVLAAASALSDQSDRLTAEVERFLASVRVSYAVSAAQVAIVQRSFATVQALGDTAAEQFYGRLFDIAPQVRSLFPDDMTAQKRKLVAMLALAVANLDKPEALVAAVRDLGDRHVGYGALRAHFEAVGAALLWTLEQGLGPDFTPEAREAWTETYRVIAGLMTMTGAAKAA